MACEFLQGKNVKTCGAVRESVALSVEELRTICQTERYHTCQVYQRRISQGIKIPIKEYERYPMFSR